MSIWTEAEGTVKIKKSSRFSLAKGLQSLYDEYTFSSSDVYSHGEYNLIKFDASICLDGIAGLTVFEKWADNIKQADPTAIIQMTVSVIIDR